MSNLFFACLLTLSSISIVFLFLLSLRRLGTRISNFAVLFIGVDLLLVTPYMSDIYARALSIAIGLFVIIFSITKIVRKM